MEDEGGDKEGQDVDDNEGGESGGLREGESKEVKKKCGSHVTQDMREILGGLRF